MKKLARILTAASSSALFLSITQSALAQTASTLSADKGGTGGTGSALLDAGGGTITYILFFVGLTLFVVGSLKIVGSFRD